MNISKQLPLDPTLGQVPIKPDAKTSESQPVENSAAPKATPSDAVHITTSTSPLPAVSPLLQETPESTNPWKIERMHINAGYIVHNSIPYTGAMHITNPAYGTDVTITGIQQTQRTSWNHLTIGQGHRFAPDEPQFIVGVNMEFANKFGLELDAKHNKIIVDGYDQEVHFDGTINGQEVNGTAPLNTFMHQHEQTLGNMQIGLLATRNFDLPAPQNHRFSFITKAGPAMIVTNTRSALVNPSGEVERTTSKIGVAGYGFEVENGLRYEFGPKLGRIGIEVAHGLSYLNFAKYPMVGGGTGSHDAFASQFSVKLTKAFDFKK